MSGHSKWSNIQATKGVADKRRAIIFTKYARLITVATKEGGGSDATKNFKLRVAVEKARSVNMPKENIERAIAKGAGTGGGEELESAMYEALALGGRLALLIECVTDNKNRSVGNVKTTLTKQGAAMGASGSAAWMFDRRGVIRVAEKISEEQQLQLIDDGAVDFVEEDGGTTIYAAPEKFWSVMQRLSEWGMATQYSELDWVPKNPEQFNEQEQNTIQRIVEALENTEDVESVYTNAA
ncbi:MAG: YebC/PmpR family DNA-binding transcriptional regulator [Candidatus Magasanikbacteria bacterium]|nr:YebC/PmpR family DNA-binding transcriptional regulator [Candidatus Magasanikbacteria bacterium]